MIVVFLFVVSRTEPPTIVSIGLFMVIFDTFLPILLIDSVKKT